jgi:hypothetical protein
MTEYLHSTWEGVINLIDLLRRNTGLALADEPQPVAGRIALIDMVRVLIAREYDLDMLEVEVHAIDIMPVHGDESFAWEVTLNWMVYCSECQGVAIVQEGFSGPYCKQHFHEALKQEWADRENDDRAIGLQ